MSYDVSLVENSGKCVTVERFTEGGTYPIGGCGDANLNITYNYNEIYRLFDFNIKDLDGKRAGDMINTLQAIVDKCGTHKFRDYWAPTPGNAGFALSILLKWAKDNPDAVFSIS